MFLQIYGGGIISVHDELDIAVSHLFSIYSGGILDLSDVSVDSNNTLGLSYIKYLFLYLNISSIVCIVTII